MLVQVVDLPNLVAANLASKRQPVSYALTLLQSLDDDPVADTGAVGGVSHLEGHQIAVCRDDGIGRLPTFVIVEVREAREVFSRTVQLQLPDVDVVHPVIATEFRDLAIGFDGSVFAIGKDAFAFVVEAWRLREVGDLAGGEIDPMTLAKGSVGRCSFT